MIKMQRFEIYRNQAGDYQWRFVASNNEIVCWGEGYTTKQGALNSINWVKYWADSADIKDLTY